MRGDTNKLRRGTQEIFFRFSKYVFLCARLRQIPLFINTRVGWVYLGKCSDFFTYGMGGFVNTRIGKCMKFIALMRGAEKLAPTRGESAARERRSWKCEALRRRTRGQLYIPTPPRAAKSFAASALYSSRLTPILTQVRVRSAIPEFDPGTRI